MSAYSGMNIKTGWYKIVNIKKYNGNNLKEGRVYYRSGLELKFCKICDHSKHILKWNNECVVIPYIKPIDNQPHRYFMDFYVQKKMPNDQVKEFLVEIKPSSFLVPPKPQKRKTKLYLEKIEAYSTNRAKWKQADKYCKERGWEFTIITEKNLS